MHAFLCPSNNRFNSSLLELNISILDVFWLITFLLYLVPFLAVRDDFHQKRNQARQKLATLPVQRYKDLASDVFYEIERRFPSVIDHYCSKYGDNVSNIPKVSAAEVPLFLKHS